MTAAATTIRQQVPSVMSGTLGPSCCFGATMRRVHVSRLGLAPRLRPAARWNWNRGSRTRGIATSNLSYSEGPTEPPLLHETIPENFAKTVSQYGDHVAFITRDPVIAKAEQPLSASFMNPVPETILTYESLDLLSNTLAHSLQNVGVKKGDRVAVSLGNVSEHIVLMYAIFKLGAILVPLNPNFNSEQVGAALSHLGVELLIIGAVTDLAYKPCQGRSNLPLLSSLIPNLQTHNKIESPTVPTLKSVILVDNTTSHPSAAFPPLRTLPALIPYSSLLPASSSSSVTPDAPLSPNDTINIQFTSGTTSMPKAAMLSHTSILNNGRFVASRMGLVPADRIVCPPPLFHCFGSVIGVQATASTGAALLFSSPAFDPRAALEMVARHRATGLHGVSTMFVAMLELLSSPSSPSSPSAAEREAHFRTSLTAHLRKGVAAGSSIPEPLMARLDAELGLGDLVICYGMTETGPVSVMTAPGDPREKRTGSVGRAMPHTGVKIVDPARRERVLERGQRGELAAGGYLVMRGYWGVEGGKGDLRVEGEEGGKGGKRSWMYSGDEAVMDRDGYVQITGRIKDLIIRGGENIHPFEVESCLFRHALVREVSVVGVPDERHGEAVGAFVVVHEGVAVGDGGEKAGGEGGEGAKKVLTKEDVRAWVRENLSGHLVPKHVFFVEEFPKTASGKIQKFKLKDLAVKMLGEGEGKGK
ncbi:AMP-binding enzyme [Camillea tinctor]|nr:AMP-binding enzyme [Camillea tinctor]